MADNNPNDSRRRFLRGAVAGAIAAPVVGLLGSERGLAADKPKLSPDDPQAKALNYVHKASEASDHAAFKEGSNCANCAQWTSASDAAWGDCAIFPGKLVANDGWCTAWAKAAG